MPLQSISWLPIQSQWFAVIHVAAVPSSAWLAPVLCWASAPGLLCVSQLKSHVFHTAMCVPENKGKTPLARAGLCPRAGSWRSCCVQASATNSVQRLCNLSLILAVGYGWKLKLSANVFCISAFLKYFTCCVHIYLSPFPSLLLFFPLQLLI